VSKDYWEGEDVILQLNKRLVNRTSDYSSGSLILIENFP